MDSGGCSLQEGSCKSTPLWKVYEKLCEKYILLVLAHQNRTIAIASDFRVDGAKSPEIPQKEGALGSEFAARNRKSLATFHRTLKSQCSIAFSCLGNRAIKSFRVRDRHRNRKSQKSLRFWCAKLLVLWPRSSPSDPKIARRDRGRNKGPICPSLGPGARGHHERGLLLFFWECLESGRILLFSTDRGFSENSYFSRMSRKSVFFKRPLSSEPKEKDIHGILS